MEDTELFFLLLNVMIVTLVLLAMLGIAVIIFGSMILQNVYDYAISAHLVLGVFAGVLSLLIVAFSTHFYNVKMTVMSLAGAVVVWAGRAAGYLYIYAYGGNLFSYLIAVSTILSFGLYAWLWAVAAKAG